MKVIKVGLDGLTALDKVAKALFIETKMAGNLNFPSPVPSLADMKAGREKLEAAVAATLDGGKAVTFAKNEAEAELDELITQMAGYVVSIAGGDEAMIRGGGFDVRRRGEPRGPLSAPANLRADLTAFEGQIRLDWDRENGALVFEVGMNDKDPNLADEWRVITMTTKSKFLVENLESGKSYWFRVKAQGASGESPYSDPARSKAR